MPVRRSWEIVVLILFLCLALLSWRGNADHRSEQGVYRNYHKPLGIALWSGQGYRFPSGDPALYPLYGYPIVVGLLRSDALISGSQVLAVAMLCWFLCRRGLSQPFRWLTSIFFLPIFLHASVKWPDAWYVVAMLSLYAAVAHNRWIPALLAGALAAVMRPDFLPFACFALLIAFIAKSSRLARIIGIALTGALLALLPWAIFTLRETGAPSLTSFNGGMVFYISLGQLPGNPWGREYTDGAAIAMAQAAGFEPFSPAGQSYLIRQAVADIVAYPRAYVDKVLYNLFRAMTRGVYAESPILRFAFNPLAWGGLVIAFFCRLHSRRDSASLFALILFLFSLAWISLLQYIPRHLNAAYAVMLVHLWTMPQDQRVVTAHPISDVTPAAPPTPEVPPCAATTQPGPPSPQPG